MIRPPVLTSASCLLSSAFCPFPFAPTCDQHIPSHTTSNIPPKIPLIPAVPRAASKMVPNRLLFGGSFDRPARKSEASYFAKQAISLPRKRTGREIALLPRKWMPISKRPPRLGASLLSAPCFRLSRARPSVPSKSASTCPALGEQICENLRNLWLKLT